MCNILQLSSSISWTIGKHTLAALLLLCQAGAQSPRTRKAAPTPAKETQHYPQSVDIYFHLLKTQGLT